MIVPTATSADIGLATLTVIVSEGYSIQSFARLPEFWFGCSRSNRVSKLLQRVHILLASSELPIGDRAIWSKVGLGASRYRLCNLGDLF